MKHLLFFLIALLFLTEESYAHKNNSGTFLSPVVNTRYGKIQGLVIAQDSLVQFRGIPYAQAPVGNRRWRRPLPPKAWRDTLKAVTWPDIALQTNQDKGSFYEKEFFRFGMPKSSENCLFINITMPLKALAHLGALPVCVWYHGGAYQNGYSYEMEMDPTEWARRGDAINSLASVRDSLSGKPVYAYKFCRRLPGDNAGAFHSSELWYTFGSMRHSWRPFTKEDYELSERMLEYWTNFVKYGNPNKNQGTGTWRPNTSKDHYFQILDTD